MDSENREYIEELRPVIQKFHHDVAPYVLEAYEDFAAKSAELRRHVLENPSMYWNMQKYVQGSTWSVSPTICFYSADERFSLASSLDKPENKDCLWEYAKFDDDRTGQTLYSPRLLQTDVRTFESGETMDRPIWNRFVMTVGCYPAVLETVDWLHPLHGFWLRRLMTRVRVRRRTNQPGQPSVKAG